MALEVEVSDFHHLCLLPLYKTLNPISVFLQGTCQPMRCRLHRQCCPRSAPNGWRRTRPHVALCYRTARPPTARPRRAMGAEGGGLAKQSRLPAPLATTSTSTTSPDRPSSSPTRPALQSASSPSAVTQMRKMTTNKTTGQLNCRNVFMFSFLAQLIQAKGFVYHWGHQCLWCSLVAENCYGCKRFAGLDQDCRVHYNFTVIAK